jgi:hypothetical protein
MKSKISVLMLLSLILFLTGCKQGTVRPTIPASLLEPTEVTTAKYLQINTYGDIIDTYVPYLKSRIGICNTDKKSIKDWENKLNEVR